MRRANESAYSGSAAREKSREEEMQLGGGGRARKVSRSRCPGIRLGQHCGREVLFVTERLKKRGNARTKQPSYFIIFYYIICLLYLPDYSLLLLLS